MRLSAASSAAALVAVCALALSGCSAADSLRIDGSDGSNATCVTSGGDDGGVVFGVSVTNDGSDVVTISAVEPLETMAVRVTEIAIADVAADGLGWGTATVDAIPDELRDRWEARTDAVGSTVEPGETRFLLLVVANAGAPDQTTGIRGLRVEFDSASGSGAIENDDVYGFTPDGAACDAGGAASA